MRKICFINCLKCQKDHGSNLGVAFYEVMFFLFYNNYKNSAFHHFKSFKTYVLIKRASWTLLWYCVTKSFYNIEGNVVISKFSPYLKPH